MKPILLNLEPLDYSTIAKKMLEEYFEYRELDSNLPVKNQIMDATAVITRLGFKIDSALISEAVNLKYVLTATTGTNHIDEKLLTKRGALTISLKGETRFLERITPTAEHTWGLLLALCRNYKAAFEDVHCYNWNRDAHLGTQLLGKTIGILGLGRLGKMVANYATAFGMNVIYTDIAEQNLMYKKVELLELLSESDVVSIHLPLNDDTFNLVDVDFFAALKPGAFLINTARGEILDEQALLGSLKSGRLKGAALDVMDQESDWQAHIPRNNPIVSYAKKHSNLILTPHIGGACPNAMRMTEEFIASKLLQVFLEKNNSGV